EPVRLPPAEGVKVTLIVQFAPAARLNPQVFVCVKSPLAVMALIVSGPLPEFVSFTCCVALEAPTRDPEKVREAADKVALCVGPPPVPAKVTLCGLPEASSATLRDPERAPPAVGANVTLIVQLEPAAREELQVWVSAKSPVVVM